MIRLLLTAFITLCSSLGFGQVLLSGTVAHGGSGLDNVTIQIVENDKILRTIAASKRGKYEMELSMGHNYTLVFRRPYMFPVRLVVNTTLDGDVNTQSYEVPLDMTMFYRYEGMRESLAADNIGTIEHTGTGENTFSFIPNQRAIENLKLIKEESLLRESKREGAVEAISLNNEAKVATKSDEESQDLLEDVIEEQESEDKLSPTIDIDEPISKLDRQNERYEIIESTKNVELDVERERKEVEIGSSTSKKEIANAYIRDSKRRRARLIAEDSRREEALVDAAVHQQESQVEGLLSGRFNRKSAVSQDKIEILKYAEDEGWLTYEETILVKDKARVDTYKKVQYDWLVIDWAYYYLNEVEISEKEYEKIKSLVEM